MTRIAISLIVIIMLAACADTGDALQKPMSIKKETDSVVLASGEMLRFTRGVITVAENRTRDLSRSIDVEFHIIPAQIDAPAGVPPIYLLRGGPGFEGLDPLLEQPMWYELYLLEYTKIAPVVVVGQRGFGQSSSLPCPSMPEVQLDEVSQLSDRLQRYKAGALKCRDFYEAKGVDLSGYNVNEMANDVLDVASALAHDRIQLVGNSFGSHWAMAILRIDAERVSRVVLTALEGVDHTFDLLGEKRRTLERIAAEAEAQPALAPLIPESGLVKSFANLVAQAEQSPIVVETTHVGTGETLSLTIDGDALRSLAQGTRRGTTWRHLMAVWPGDLLEMLTGNFEAASIRLQNVWLNNRVQHAAYFSAECASGLSTKRNQQLQDELESELVLPAYLWAAKVCDSWPADLGDGFREGFTTDVPALLFHGTWDTSTSVENAKDVRKTFRNHEFIKIRGGSHGALIEAIEQDRSIEQQVLGFIRTGDATDLPAVIELPPLNWKVPVQD
ncbi:MAG: alpha/beta fold hydrolase [Woeseiaceae bacterium]